MDRRPLKSRGTAWAQGLAKYLAETGMTPNQISILSIVMSIFAMISFYYSQDNRPLLILAAVFIQMRLLCNLFDGMVAVEHGKKTNTGDIFNDAPDRFADLFIILGAGLAVMDRPYAIELAWAGAAFAIMTAYIRVLGKSVGTQSYFSGPMAKQHRMFIITATALIDTVLHFSSISFSTIYIALYIIAIGSFLTSLNRLNKIVNAKQDEL